MNLRRALLQFSLANAAVAAFDPAIDSPCEGEGICLSSFIWCSNESESHCFFPEGVDPLTPTHASAFAVLYHGNQYEITWRNAAPDLPVLVQWPSALETFPFDPEESEELRVIWSTIEAPEVSSYMAAVGTQGVGNFIRVSQPESGPPYSGSQQFMVQMPWTATLVSNMKTDYRQRQAEREKKWRLGVGIGVGLGVPILMGLTWSIASRKTAVSSMKTPEGE